MRDDFNDFARRHKLYSNNDEKVVYVVPVFEIQKGFICPNEKQELKDSCNRKEVRSFHEEVRFVIIFFPYLRITISDLQVVS